jgi:hypothetical protein
MRGSDLPTSTWARNQHMLFVFVRHAWRFVVIVSTAAVPNRQDVTQAKCQHQNLPPRTLIVSPALRRGCLHLGASQLT